MIYIYELRPAPNVTLRTLERKAGKSPQGGGWTHYEYRGNEYFTRRGRIYIVSREGCHGDWNNVLWDSDPSFTREEEFFKIPDSMPVLRAWLRNATKRADRIDAMLKKAREEKRKIDVLNTPMGELQHYRHATAERCGIESLRALFNSWAEKKETAPCYVKVGGRPASLLC